MCTFQFTLKCGDKFSKFQSLQCSQDISAGDGLVCP